MDAVRCSLWWPCSRSHSLFQPPSIDDLPDCVLSEILILLPQKSIIQCKCVSQRWCSLISSPSFAYFVNSRFHASTLLQRPSTLLFSYNNHGKKNKMVLVTSEEPEFKSLASLIHQYYNTNSFVSDDIAQASCHDLLLCYENVFVADDDGGSRPMTVYYVLNPITRQSVALPPLRRSRSARIGFIFSRKKERQSSYRVMRIPKFKG
ncbi:putative F-box protein At1g47300 [Castanea sativa]|uniref:putative F-box protein At1g47300 n=1 Tax=Castanea sativa TaxID=21020 RepID=UPI003F650A70